VYGGCSYPISRKKWILSVPPNNAAAIECTGASPHRCQPKNHQKAHTRGEENKADLVIKPAAGFEEIEESGIGGTAPEVQIGDLKVAPDWCAQKCQS
jgi:hypothetical protein